MRVKMGDSPRRNQLLADSSSASSSKNRKMTLTRPSEEVRAIWTNHAKRTANRRRGQIVDSSKETFQAILTQMEEIRRKLAIAEYYRILATFTNSKDGAMPWPLNPVEFALNGWEYFSTGTVRCPFCKRTCFLDVFSYNEIFHGLSPTDQNMRAWIIEEFRKQLTDPGHDQYCSRPRLPLPSEVNQFVLFSFKSFSTLFEQRLKSLTAMGKNLPVLGKRYYELFSEEVVCKTVSKIVDIDKPSILMTAAILALHGWSSRTDSDACSSSKEISCRECAKNVDCTGFCSVDRMQILEENEKADFHPYLFSWPKPEEFRFGCRLGHFPWCPWVRPVSLQSEHLEQLSLKASNQICGSEVAVLAFNKEYIQAKSDTEIGVDASSESSQSFRMQFTIRVKDIRKEMETLLEKARSCDSLNVLPSSN